LQRLRLTFDDGVVVATIHAPPLNHFSIALAGDVLGLCAWLRRTAAARVIVFRSDIDGFFIPHLDLDDVSKLPTPPPLLRDLGLLTMRLFAHLGPVARQFNRMVLGRLSPFHAALDAVTRIPQPTIAAVEGRIGGLGSEFAMCLDMRFADRERAVLNQLEAACGLFPGAGGTQRLPRLVGPGRAQEIALSSADIDATTAERWGYFNRALPTGEVLDHVLSLARRIARFPREGVRTGRRLVARAMVPNERLLQLEAIDFMRMMFSDVTRGRIAALLEAGGQTRDGAADLGRVLGNLGADGR
jgi:enoyl-CoA hydratase/carnithine racemase